MPHPTKAGVVQVRCTCGRESAVEIASFGRPLRCRACRSSYVPVWGIHPKSKQAVPMAFEHRAGAPRGFKVPSGVGELPCPCGQKLYARPRHAGKRVQCPVCATWMKLEQSRDPQTLETRIRVVQSRLNQLPAVPPQPVRAPAAPDGGGNVQLILCSCGESLRLDPALSGNRTQCPACGTQMRLELRKGLQGSPCIIVNPVPEMRGIEEELSLDDFT